MIGKRVRAGLRAVLKQTGAVVGKDNLFEQPGERPSSQPIQWPKVAAVAAAPAAAPPSTLSTPVAHTRGGAQPAPAQAARPAEGCVPVDAAGLALALRPSGRPLVINHWATWCDPCVDELPRLVRAAAGLADSAEFLGVSWDLFDHPQDAGESARHVADFAGSSGVGFGSVLFTGEPAELFKVCGLDTQLVPQTLVIAPDGRIVWHKKGMLLDDDVFPLIAAARAAAA